MEPKEIDEAIFQQMIHRRQKNDQGEQSHPTLNSMADSSEPMTSIEVNLKDKSNRNITVHLYPKVLTILIGELKIDLLVILLEAATYAETLGLTYTEFSEEGAKRLRESPHFFYDMVYPIYKKAEAFLNENNLIEDNSIATAHSVTIKEVDDNNFFDDDPFWDDLKMIDSEESDLIPIELFQLPNKVSYLFATTALQSAFLKAIGATDEQIRDFIETTFKDVDFGYLSEYSTPEKVIEQSEKLPLWV